MVNKHPVSKQNVLAIMQRQAQLMTLPFDVSLTHVLDSRLPVTIYYLQF